MHPVSRFLGAIAPLLLVPAPPALAAPSWETLPNAPVAFFRHEDLWFIDANTGWVVNSLGEVHRTTDGGATWALLATTGTFNRSVGFANATHGWIGTLTPPDVILRTTDGGFSWTPATVAGTSNGVCGIWVSNEQVINAVGTYFGPSKYYRSTDGGVTWTNENVGAGATTLIDCWFPSPDTGFVVGGRGTFPDFTRARILATTDGGTTWEIRFDGSRFGEWGWKLSFPTPLVGYVSLERSVEDDPGFFAKTTDGGLTWVDAPFASLNEQAIGFATENLGWIGGSFSPTHVTTDGGATWSTPAFGENLNRVRFLSPNLAYAVGLEVYKYSDPAAVSAPVVAGAPLELLPNRPNPFAPSTIIPFALNRPGRARVAVYDVTGRLVATIVDEPLPAGGHRVEWNGRTSSGRAAPAGVYLYRLEHDGFVESRKMVLRR